MFAQQLLKVRQEKIVYGSLRLASSAKDCFVVIGQETGEYPVAHAGDSAFLMAA